MQVWRINRGVYSPLDGEGARRRGQRWNPTGMPVVYTAAHLSLCVLELLVHVDPEYLPDDLFSFQIDIPDAATVTEVEGLPPSWKTDVDACRALGTQWAEAGETALLSVPSAVLEQERNYVLNPRHPSFADIRVVARRPFRFDERLPGFRTGSAELRIS